MKKAVVISSIVLLTFAGAILFANSLKSDEPVRAGCGADSTMVKPCENKSDSTHCAKGEHKDGCCKKSGSKPCCKKN